ncbi:hypothetical protein [Acinetobacter pittii]|uniref:hypothetical protein n=1 Tax=Acinetobacter pittii TaxID=48296 RepID=UPI00246932C9|nr:hypothetical protein [Acinetobacter pittii]WGM23782.1 hypothetical protein OFU58_13955 [Acinetobacter pittii]
MSVFSRNQKTNGFLGTIYDYLVRKEGDKLTIPVTFVVNGLMITGELISHEEFFTLEENKPYAPLYNAAIAEEELKYFDEKGNIRTEYLEKEEEIPDFVWQRFVYLKNARYISGGNFMPSPNHSGTSIQIRATDISAMSLASFGVETDSQ